MVHCIGDSHCRLFKGTNTLNTNEDRVPGFIVSHISGHLAYNVCNENHPVRISIDKVMHKHPVENVVFFYGEIDCRCHLPKYAREFGVLPAVESCVDRYVDGLNQISTMTDATLAAFAPYFTPKVDRVTEGAGTWNEIFQITVVFEHVLRDRFERVASLNDWLMDQEAWNKKEFYIDPTHLSIKCLPKAIEEVNRVLGL